MLITCLVALYLIGCTQGAETPVTVIPPASSQSNADYRLPKSVKPSAYIITIAPYFENFTFDGEVKINISTYNATKNITLHYDTINITETTLTDSDNEQVKIKIQNYQEDTDFYILELDKELPVDKQYTLHIKYRGYLLPDMNGFYRSSYKTSTGETRWLASTQFEPLGARKAFPCFDEPEYKANFQINIIRDVNRSSISNAPLNQTIPIDKENDIYMDVFETTPEMSTYLVAFVVSDFKKKEDPASEMTYTMWAQPELVQNTQFALNMSVKIMEYMENFTDIKYELDKIEQIAIPDFVALAMENWGLVIYREDMLLVNDENALVSNQKRIATTIAHEFTHQWFGNLVTPAWWNHLWLSEGFASYFEYFAVHEIMPEWRLDEQFVVDRYQAALRCDDTASSHAVKHDIFKPEQIYSNFDFKMYYKANSIIRSIQHILSEYTFKNAIRNYLKEHEYSVATDADLFQAFEIQQKEDGILKDINITDVFKSWIEKAGYPLINVTTNQKTKKYHVSQAQFLETGTKDSAAWYVPLSYTTKNELNFKDTKPRTWLKEEKNEKEMDITDITVSDDQWIIFNINATGLYRVLYEEDNYKLLTAHLKSDKLEQIPPVNRAQLIDDALNLARGGLLNYTIVLDLTEYLVNEKDYIPWASFFNSIAYVKSQLSNTELYENFKVYLKTLIGKLYADYSEFKVSDNDSQTNRLLRMKILNEACGLDFDTCNAEASKKLEMLMEDGNAEIQADLMSVVYCFGIRAGGDREWQFLWDRYNTILDPSEKLIILYALTCSKDTEKLQFLLKSSVEDDSGIRKQDIKQVIFAVFEKPDGADLALEFLDTNFVQMKQLYDPIDGLTNLVSAIASQIKTPEQQQKYAMFYANHVDELGTDEPAAKQGFTKILQNFKWLQTNIDTFQQWFAKYPAPATTETETSTEPIPTLHPVTETTTQTDAATSFSISLALIVGCTMFLIGQCLEIA